MDVMHGDPIDAAPTVMVVIVGDVLRVLPVVRLSFAVGGGGGEEAKVSRVCEPPKPLPTKIASDIFCNLYIQIHFKILGCRPRDRFYYLVSRLPQQRFLHHHVAVVAAGLLLRLMATSS